MKKMTIVIIVSIYLALSVIIYLSVSGFYFTRKYFDKYLKATNMSVDQLDNSKDKIRKRVFAGIVETNINKKA